MIVDNIYTDRLIIREFTIEDVDSVQAYGSDEEVVKFLPWGPNNLEDTKVFVEKIIGYQSQNPREDFEFAIVKKDDNTLIGACAIHVSSSKNKQGWIGYCYNKKFWGNGYATEAAKAVIKFGFNTLKLHRIFATCDPENKVSAKVLENSGMKFEGRLRDNKFRKGQWRDSLMFSILDNDI